MKNWDDLIEKAKEEIKTRMGRENIDTVTIKHEHGFIVMELEAFFKLPKAQRNKIYKLGGN